MKYIVKLRFSLFLALIPSVPLYADSLPLPGDPSFSPGVAGVPTYQWTTPDVVYNIASNTVIDTTVIYKNEYENVSGPLWPSDHFALTIQGTGSQELVFKNFSYPTDGSGNNYGGCHVFSSFITHTRLDPDQRPFLKLSMEVRNLEKVEFSNIKHANFLMECDGFGDSTLAFSSINKDIVFSGNEVGMYLLSVKSRNNGTNTLSFNNLGGNLIVDNNWAVGLGFPIFYVGLWSHGEGQTAIDQANNTTRTMVMEFKDIAGTVSFTNNRMDRDSNSKSGGAVLEIGNYADYAGSTSNKYPLERDAHMIFQNIGGGLLFDANEGWCAEIDMGRYTGADAQFESELIFDNIQGSGVTMTNNEGGFMLLRGHNSKVSFNNISQLTFRDNVHAVTANASGAAISISAYKKADLLVSNIDRGVVFDGNQSLSNGGAVAVSNINTDYTSSATVRFEQIRGGLLFQNNACIREGKSLWGGAIYVTTTGKADLYFGNVEGDIEFLNNNSNAYGGAVALYCAQSHTVFSADYGNVLFSGNTQKSSANAVLIGGNEINLEFRALAGRNVTLEDPLQIYYTNINKSGVNDIDIHFNKSDNGIAYEGDIILSGKNFAGDDKAVNRVYSVVGDTTLHAGTLKLKDGVMYGKYGFLSETEIDLSKVPLNSFNMSNAKLDMNSAQEYGDTIVSAQSINFGSNSTLKPGKNADLIAKTVNLESGLAFDLGYYLPAPDQFNDLKGLKVYSTDMNVGGYLSIADKGQKLEYYENSRWRGTQTFTLLNLVLQNDVTGDFDGIKSQLASSDLVKGFGYNGQWTYEWQDSDKDGVKDALVAIWSPILTPTPEPEPEKKVNPELEGSLVINSLWTTVSNMKAVGRSAMEQVGLSRLLDPRDTNYWMLSLGDFASHKSVEDIDGFSYNGYGYVVGADKKLDKTLLAGVAFGNLYGDNKSRLYSAKVDQTSYIGMCYASWYADLGDTNKLVVNGSASYGRTSNKLDAYFSDGDRAEGKWNNNAVRFTLKAEWVHQTKKNGNISLFIGLEYDDATQKSFTETGDKARRFDETTLRNLALPVGVGWSGETTYSNGMKYLNSLAASYIPDVIRTNPSSHVLRSSTDFTWLARGVSPTRNAGRLEYYTRWTIDPTWAIFASYSFEGRKNSLYHNAFVGVSASF
ncbi:autotransporter outer membrane beta-barrel domain-containing protein [Akkermansia massiliensis]|uniref:autotransporter outer membrane beta-barrel domain-containing protein n=1 Tax=Akkermansia massiliensis TaxID=2927224 RepID=UPI00202E55EA|nr:autotransporter outer membrane beta-barrel domain-containing protein [Akkermansia sp. B2-R-115]MCM0686331.1 autotransporter outer membrane beta-barrel domain-containing protein [Akkermansia sp. B2-R-115]